MTFDDDFIRIGLVVTRLADLGIEWPPPPFIKVNNHGERPNLFFRQVSMSEITDEQRVQMTSVARGAQYEQCSATDLPHDEPEVAQ
jgi:hypothetical protein